MQFGVVEALAVLPKCNGASLSLVTFAHIIVKQELRMIRQVFAVADEREFQFGEMLYMQLCKPDPFLLR